MILRYVGIATDESWKDYWFAQEKTQAIMRQDDINVKEYQRKCRYHEEHVTEMADAIIGENL